MAPFEPGHYKAATRVYSPAAQDAFDSRLNQTIFAGAFGIAGLVFLGVLAYLSYWVLGHCRVRKRDSVDAGEFKAGPQALLLPGQVAARGKPEEDAESVVEEKIGESEPDRRRFWFRKMRMTSRDVKTGDRSTSSDKSGAHTSPARPPPAHLNPRFSAYAPCSPRAGLADSGDNSADVPRINIEDADPALGSSATSHDGASSDSSSDLSVDEKEQSDELLAVPPMSWNAPRYMVQDDLDTDMEVHAPKIEDKNLALRRMKSKPQQKSETIFTLTSLSSITRFRPRLSRQIMNKAKPITGICSR